MKYNKYIYTLGFKIISKINDNDFSIITKDIIFDSMTCLSNQIKKLYNDFDGCPIILYFFKRVKVNDCEVD